MNAIELAPNIFKPKSNLFQPRNNWGLVALTSRRELQEYDINTFIRLIAFEIKNKTGIDPYENIKYRGREYVEARQLLMVMLRNYASKSLHATGRILKKNHATVVYAEKTIKNLVETNKEFRSTYQEINERVRYLSLKLRRS